ncbi:MAG: hypothetical protein GX075_11100 [Firmicutes bacterium]|nr:hypothetical protein [Bacillota bacterium]
MKKLIYILILGLCLTTISIFKWKDIRTYFARPQIKSIRVAVAQEDPRVKEEVEIKKLLAKEFTLDGDFNDSEYEILIIRDWSFGHVNGKGFVARKTTIGWEVVPYAKWNQLIEEMPEDIRLKWGEYMNPGD